MSQEILVRWAATFCFVMMRVGPSHTKNCRLLCQAERRRGVGSTRQSSYTKLADFKWRQDLSPLTYAT